MNGDQHHMPDMDGITITDNKAGSMNDQKVTMMHPMTFFWGKNAEILFSGWPGTRDGMYALALICIFFLALIVEWLSNSKLIRPGSSNVVAGVLQTLLHVLKVGLAYMLMLALMSFNGGVFMVALAGHLMGFLVFGSRAFNDTKEVAYQKTSDLPPVAC
ncbi:hypothetical protein K2173_016617 [Erythroxylum novogranatense]|uniref:Copper transport protein n=1 Tax=Erythroxylum novogranatense TaxID=1862640 RepID=A0AAV8SGS5_9ROSI|nr:hypothetical protein K2173_016617 [Erythroxylum novogranatense]